MNAHEYMEKYNLAPPISMVPCAKCGAPSDYHFVGGSFCGYHWAEAYREFHDARA